MAGFEDFLRHPAVVNLGLALGRYLPRRAGYGIARSLAWYISLRKPPTFHTVQDNFRQILGPETDQAALDELAFKLYLQAGKCYYDFFHAAGKSPTALKQLVKIPTETIKKIKEEYARGHGVLILGMHMSNFDLAGLAVAAHGLPIQLLSLAEPPPDVVLFNELRSEAGFEITPITPDALRQAIRRLRNGGIVGTGADRPIPEDQALIPFFGREAYLPQGPARLALLTGATVFLGACHHSPDTGYVVEVLGPLEVVKTGDRQADIYNFTRRLAVFMEAQIRARPEQWMMFHPFWPVPGTG
jgi:KDO2-lipid IV(A) lauroyltransferase